MNPDRPSFPVLSDEQDRELAATTFDRNLIVTAGAGTGKTTLLVDRLVNLLMRQPDPLQIDEIIALTFTNKAANEMKVRLRDRLQSLLTTRLDLAPASDDEEKRRAEIISLIQRYHLTKDQIDARVREALRKVERSEIGTIHGFAASLLRLYPVEADLDPQFQEDDGTHFDRHFEEGWLIWLDRELSRRGDRKEDWKQVLRKISLDDLRELARCLCSETVPLESLSTPPHAKRRPAQVTQWLRELEQKAQALLQKHAQKHRLIEDLVEAALKIFQEALQNGEIREGKLGNELEAVAEKQPSPVQGWNLRDVSEARTLVRAAKRLGQVDLALTSAVCDLLLPFARDCRQNFVRRGFVSFDGLLVRARDLVRDHLTVREELKHRFKAMLIDEFQDTDPIQYEILLYLAERSGHAAKDWKRVQLAPGKIFVVGDPKQSIYAFRRADIEAYLDVVENIILKQNGRECRLTVNFRSHSKILDVVNGVFEKLILPRKGLQPQYVAIESPRTADTVPPDSATASFRKIVIRQVDSEEPLSAGKARNTEAESLARWLHDEVIGKAGIVNGNQEQVLVQPRDVALLFRKLTDVHLYLEPLRRMGIRYVVEGERHFYAAQEVIDGVNLLRSIENPYDKPALVGVLRSPIGGLTDAEIYALHRQGLLHYQNARKTSGDTTSSFDSVKDLYEILARLHATTRALAVGDAVNLIFDTIPIRILASQSFNGEQAVANLEKIREQAGLLGREGIGTLKEVVATLERRVLDVKDEGESALAEEEVDAVRILSVHKAKGLEFPVVILPDAGGTTDQRETGIWVQYDWSTKLAGLRIRDYCNLEGVFLAEKRRLRDEEEQKRVLYVAMTRAREHLTISCAPQTIKKNDGSFYLLLQECLPELSPAMKPSALAAGKGNVDYVSTRERLAAPKREAERGRGRAEEDNNWGPYTQLWQKRRKEYDAARESPMFLTPTLVKQSAMVSAEAATVGARSRFAADRAALIGILAHRFLQGWDFSAERSGLEPALALFLEGFQTTDGDRDLIRQELTRIFLAFFASNAYEEISSGRILGREIAFIIPWNGRIMEGVIDLIYERRGRLYLADYKTDTVTRDDLSHRSQEYRYQAEIYSKAAHECLRREVARFKLIFLRLGKAVEMSLEQGSLQYTLPL